MNCFILGKLNFYNNCIQILVSDLKQQSKVIKVGVRHLIKLYIDSGGQGFFERKLNIFMDSDVQKVIMI